MADLAGYPTSEEDPSFSYDERVLILRGTHAIISGVSSAVNGGTRVRALNDIEDECDFFFLSLIEARIAQEIRSVVSPVIAPDTIEMLGVFIFNATKYNNVDESTLLYVFDLQVRIRSPLQEYNIEDYVIGGFDTEEQMLLVVSYLRANTACPSFESASEVDLVISSASALSNEERATDDGTQGTILITGSVAALAAGAILTAVFVFVRIVARRNGGSSASSVNASAEAPVLDTHDHEAISEIGVQTSYEVSTLGDPPIVGSAPNEEPQETSTNDSFSLDYDYQKPIIPKNNSCSSVSESDGTMKSHQFVSADDDTLGAQYVAGEQFEVYAPPGLLGLILETDSDGVPVVKNVKETSVLSDAVERGDRLLAVDGIDVVLMLAANVSRLIASKKDQPERHFLFAKPLKQENSSAGSSPTR